MLSNIEILWLETWDHLAMCRSEMTPERITKIEQALRAYWPRISNAALQPYWDKLKAQIEAKERLPKLEK